MCFKTFRATVKTIIRSPLIWAAMALLFGVGVYFSLIINTGQIDIKTYEMVWDTDPRFVFSYKMYIQKVLNTLMAAPLMWFSAPAFCVIVTGVLLTRDWRDNFFEIERSAGVKPYQYLLGRFFAVLLFVTLLTLLTAFTAFHTYFLSRGGVSFLTPAEYFFDSSIRILRAFFMATFPGILIFVSFTFALSSIMKSGLAGTIGGLGLVIFKYLSQGILQNRLPGFYHNYLSPTSANLYRYWSFYDTEWFYEKTEHNPFTTHQMLLCLSCLYLISVICIGVSYLCVKKRKA